MPLLIGAGREVVCVLLAGFFLSHAAGAMAKAKRVDPRKPIAVDVALGHNVRFWRLARGLSQTHLATRLGITFQQVQKYEAGDNRVSMGRLVKTAAILRVPIAALFEGAETDGPLLAPISDSRSFRLARAFAAIKNNKARVSLVNMVENIAAAARRRSKKRRRGGHRRVVASGEQEGGMIVNTS